MSRPARASAERFRWAALVPPTLFMILAALVWSGWQPLRAVDTAVVAGLHGWTVHRPAVEPFVRVATALGSGELRTVMLTVATLYLLVRRSFRLGVFVAVSGIGGEALNRLAKAAVGQARPALTAGEESGFGFPSGHAMGSAVTVMVLLIVLLPHVSAAWGRGLVAGGGIVVLAVGLSRVMLGVHWLSDVLGGWMLAPCWIMVMTAVFRPGWRRSRGT